MEINRLYEKVIETGYAISMKECKGGYPNKQDCEWYHSNWMLLRYLGMVSNPFWHELFYRQALECRLNENPKILVAGTADFSMPMLVTECGFDRLSICDICRTPLIICKLIAESQNYKWDTFVHDVREDFSIRYNIIVNDAFLSRFPDKFPVLCGVSKGLDTNGVYITTVKLGRWNYGGEVTKTLADNFVSKLKQRYIANKSILPEIDIEQVGRTYVKKMASFPVRDENELRTLFKDSGFRILFLERCTVPGEYEESEYFHVVAQKIG